MPYFCLCGPFLRLVETLKHTYFSVLQTVLSSAVLECELIRVLCRLCTFSLGVHLA